MSRLEVAALGNQVGKFGTGLKTRFIYAATLGNDDGITFTSLLKYDLEACPGHMVVGQIDLGGPDCLGGEPAFVSMDPETHKGKPLHSGCRPANSWDGWLRAQQKQQVSFEFRLLFWAEACQLLCRDPKASASQTYLVRIPQVCITGGTTAYHN